MVMKVGNFYPVMFRSSMPIIKKDNNTIQYPEIKEQATTAPHISAEKNITNPFHPIVPNYSIRTPQRFQTLGITELSNGQKIYSYKLANGHRVTVVPMEGSPATVKNYVNVGSMNETDDIKGISHFLEHMAFNGTTGENGYIKLNTGDSFKKIDKLGGWTNASTNYALTDYVNSSPMLEEKDLEKQIEIIAGMTEDLALTPEMIEKEKGPVCSEINMILDNPQTIALDQTLRTLFNIKSTSDDLVGGSVKHIKNLTREDVKAYYDKYYTPDNMNLVITGDVNPDEAIELVAKNFKSTKQTQGKKYLEDLSIYAHEKLKNIKDVILLSKPKDFIILFEVKNISAQDISSYLGHKNVYVRSGYFCAKYLQHVHNNPTIRVSLHIYNNQNDIDVLCDLLEHKEDFLDFI